MGMPAPSPAPGPGRAWTRSPSPATSSGITSPTSSPSSSWEPPPRCCPSSLSWLVEFCWRTELGDRTSNAKSQLLGETLMDAIGKWLDNNKSPGRKVNQIDNRGSNFYVALYWAEALAAKDAAWAPLAKALADNEEQIVKDLIECQGPSCDVGGYYKVDPEKADIAMRPSKIFNDLMDKY